MNFLGLHDKKDRDKKILPKKEDYLSFLEMFWSPYSDGPNFHLFWILFGHD
jgi:hypothetical protein